MELAIEIASQQVLNGMTCNVAVANSQQADPSPERPSKRRRLNCFLLDSDGESSSDASHDSVDLPSSHPGYVEVDDEILQNYRSKYEDRMYEPAFVETQKNEFVTQIDQPWSSPTRIRGPRWRKKTPTPSPSPERGFSTVRECSKSQEPANEVSHRDDFDDEDIEALLNSQLPAVEGIDADQTDALSMPPRPWSKNFRQTTLFGIQTTQHDPATVRASQRAHNWPLAQRNEAPTHHKINEDAMEKWIFPLNVGSIRDYQYNIVHKALFNNVLVALPTGLGKTFIAATVMMNWYKWTKDAQIVFMAPTKPLVAQQIEACFHIAGIPRSQTTLMTGEIPAQMRAEEWQTKRVFFMTPQTLLNDLKHGIADPKRFVLLVVDEAHKATGNYAYAEVVRFLRRFTNSLRILALTATPGATVEAVQKVIDGLDIARVEIRTEDSMDIQSFVHHRNTELEVFDYSDEINMCMELFSEAVKPTLHTLCSQNVSWTRDPLKLTLYGLTQARRQWSASEAGRRASNSIKGMVHACFGPLTTLAHNLDLLKFHGIGPFYHKMKMFQDDDSGGRTARSIKESLPFTTLMSRMSTWINSDGFVGHPKLEYLKSVVLNHFMDAGEGRDRAGGRLASDTRIMIFVHFRDSAEEICRILSKHEPMVRAHVFVGQSSTKNSDGMDQKTQTQIIKKFKAGVYNTLVATSIGEEGLDIGEVDLIVCYDCSKSPIRMLQRMGRTGRRRAGNIVMLLMRDKEEGDYYKAKDNYTKIQEIIESGREFSFHDERSPRIVPKGITPRVSKEMVEIPLENTQPVSVEPRRSKARTKRKPVKKFHMPDGVETGFTFLSSRKAKDGQQQENKRQKRASILDTVDAPLPDDEVIFLSAEQQRELEEKYAWVVGDEPQFVQQVDLSQCPNKVRAMDETQVVGHSNTTKNMVEAFNIGAKLERYNQHPPESWEEEISNDASCEKEAAQVVRIQSEPPEGSQGDALPDLECLLGRTQGPTSATRGPPDRRTRRIVCDDDDDDKDQ